MSPITSIETNLTRNNTLKDNIGDNQFIINLNVFLVEYFTGVYHGVGSVTSDMQGTVTLVLVNSAYFSNFKIKI